MTAAEKLISIVRQELGYLEKALNKSLDDKTANGSLVMAGRIGPWWSRLHTRSDGKGRKMAGVCPRLRQS